MENDFGIRTAIVKAYNSVGGDAKEVDFNNVKAIPTAFKSNGELNVSEVSITNSLFELFKINPVIVEDAIAEMKNDGILNIKLVPSGSGMNLSFITMNDDTSTDEELDKFRSEFNDKAEIK
jgi:hypothetical protein